VPWRGPIKKGQTALITEQSALQGTASANQNGWLLGTRGKRGGERKILANGEAAPTAARDFRLPPNQTGGQHNYTHTHTHSGSKERGEKQNKT